MSYTTITTDVCFCNDIAFIATNVKKLPDCSAPFLPTAFSPNNDVLYVRGDQQCIKEMVFEVFDRWGEKVFATNNITSGWDGTLRGQNMNSGVFVYRIFGSLITGEEINLTGNITLVR